MAPAWPSAIESGTRLGSSRSRPLGESRLVEIVPGPATSQDALRAAGRHFAALGKHVECVAGDAPGLILGRILYQIVNEAHFAVQEGVATAEDVDTAMRLGFNWPLRPFEWAAAIGPSRVIGGLEALRSELGGNRYRVAPLLRRAALLSVPRCRKRGAPPPRC
jgi:3-hydroxybutyryl-CoA dehydrogenase